MVRLIRHRLSSYSYAKKQQQKNHIVWFLLTAPQIWGSFRKRQRPGLSSRRGRGEAPLPELSARNFRRFIYRSLSDLFKKCIGCSTIGL